MTRPFVRAFAGLALFLSCPFLRADAPSASSLPVFSPASIFVALEQAYPQRVHARNSPVGPQVEIGGDLFAWARGRLLPVDSDLKAKDFASQPFYEYPAKAPNVDTWSDAQLAQAEDLLADRRSRAPKRSSAFFDALWGIHNHKTADDSQITIRFLGRWVTINAALKDPLARVQERLYKDRLTDPEIDRFLRDLKRLDGYNWRDIAETQSRSNHAYGIAIDLIPRYFHGKNPYWLWAAQNQAGWYRAAWDNRWIPPSKVIQAFENEGFLWGGKWLMFDTIHFEYRPEILILNGMR